MPAVVQALADRGAIVEIIHPVDPIMNLSELRVEHDLYVLRHTSGVSLSLAGALHELGAVIVNPYPASAALRDKIVTMRTLQAAGVPTPASYLAPHPDHLRPLLDSGPLVIKPYQGADGAGVRVVRNDGELAAVNHGCEPLFAQRYHPGDGRDRKIYAIGGRLFGVKKVFPRLTEEEKHGEPFALTPQLHDIAERCGRAFGIDLYGVDIIESEGTPYVVDICSIPGFKGVPDAVRLLTQYFYAAAERAARGELLSHRPHWRSRGVTSMPRPQVLTDALHEHPALQAWTRVSAGSAQACSIEVLKRKRQFAVYRVNGVGPDAHRSSPNDPGRRPAMSNAWSMTICCRACRCHHCGATARCGKTTDNCAGCFSRMPGAVRTVPSIHTIACWRAAGSAKCMWRPYPAKSGISCLAAMLATTGR